MDSRGVQELVETTRRYVQPSRMLLYGSRARGTATAASDQDVLMLVCPELARPWTPLDNVRLGTALQSALHLSERRVDLQVRTIDQYAEARHVPVCPEHSAEIEGQLLWNASLARAPLVRRSVQHVLLDNARDWLRVAMLARRALLDADAQVEAVLKLRLTHEVDSAIQSSPERARQHYQRSIRAALVAFALATGAPAPDHKADLALLPARLDSRFAPIFVVRPRDDTAETRRKTATAALVVASAAVEELQAYSARTRRI